MKKKIKIIDLLCLSSCNEKLPKVIKYEGEIYRLHESDGTYYDIHMNCLWDNRCFLILNDFVDILGEWTEYGSK